MPCRSRRLRPAAAADRRANALKSTAAHGIGQGKGRVALHPIVARSLRRSTNRPYGRSWKVACFQSDTLQNRPGPGRHVRGSPGGCGFRAAMPGGHRKDVIGSPTESGWLSDASGGRVTGVRALIAKPSRFPDALQQAIGASVPCPGTRLLGPPSGGRPPRACQTPAIAEAGMRGQTEAAQTRPNPLRLTHAGSYNLGHK